MSTGRIEALCLSHSNHDIQELPGSSEMIMSKGSFDQMSSVILHISNGGREK